MIPVRDWVKDEQRCCISEISMGEMTAWVGQREHDFEFKILDRFPDGDN